MSAANGKTSSPTAPSSALHAALDGEQVGDVAAVGQARHRLHHPAAVLGLPVAAAPDHAVALLLETSQEGDELGAPETQVEVAGGGVRAEDPELDLVAPDERGRLHLARPAVEGDELIDAVLRG